MESQRSARSVRVAALLYAMELGFGVSMPLALANLARRGELPMMPIGFRAFSGPFEKAGPERFTALGVALIGVSVLDAIAAVWLWQMRRRGGILGVAMTPVATVLGLGFALPFWLLPIPIGTVLVLRAWAGFDNAAPGKTRGPFLTVGAETAPLHPSDRSLDERA